MKILVLIAIITLQVCKLVASAPAMASEAEERAALSGYGARTGLQDPLEEKGITVDPRRLNGVEVIPFESKHFDADVIGGIAFRNIGGSSVGL